MNTKSRTAFVFAGGSSLGAVQVGMLKALLKHGFEADLVVGSSVGAINAAYFAGNPTLEGLARLEAIWRGLRRSDVFPGRVEDCAGSSSALLRANPASAATPQQQEPGR